MKVKVISVFRDKFTGKYYTPGEVIEVGEEARVLDMESRRLAERIEVKNPEVKAPEEKKEVKISLFEKEFEKKALIDTLRRRASTIDDTRCARDIISSRSVSISFSSKSPASPGSV